MATNRGKAPGSLYVCATPIGNLEDITLRVLRVLRHVDLIAAEDTRKTKILLDRYHIRTPMVSCHQHNEQSRAAYLIRLLQQGTNVALLSEAGMPGISDPGERIISLAVKESIPVVVLPGPTALVTAAVVSGLPTRRFVFEGFLPRQGAARRRRLAALATENRTIICYEAPHRLRQTLADMAAVFGERRAVVARELTKVHEEVARGSLNELLARFQETKPRGEVVIVVSGCGGTRAVDWERLSAEVASLEAQGWSRSDAVREIARAGGAARRELYRVLLQNQKNES